jgi:hypothetical protein
MSIKKNSASSHPTFPGADGRAFFQKKMELLRLPPGLMAEHGKNTHTGGIA